MTRKSFKQLGFIVACACYAVVFFSLGYVCATLYCVGMLP